MRVPGRLKVKSFRGSRNKRVTIKETIMKGSGKTEGPRGTSGVSKNDGAVLAITVGNSNVAGASRVLAGSIWQDDGSWKQGGKVARHEYQTSGGGDLEVATVGRPMGLTTSHSKGGRMRNRATVPKEMFLGSSCNHGTAIYMSAASSEPCRVGLSKVLICGNTITISKQSHIYQGFGEGTRCSMVSRNWVI